MAVHRGRSLQAALALTTVCSDIDRCTGTVGMAEAKCSRSIAVRRGKDKGMNFPRNLCLRELQHPGDQAFGVRHVRSIFLTERFKHHLFFPPHTEGIKDACSNKPGTTCEPMGQD